MPRNGSGSYSLPQPPFVPNTVIASAAVNSDLSDIATALTQSVSADGQTTITGVLKSNIIAAPQLSSSSDTTTGFSSNTGEADTWVSGSKVIAATSSGAAVTGNLSATGTFSATGTTTLGTENVTTSNITTLNVSGILTDTNTGYWIPPAGTTLQRPGSPSAGWERFNTGLASPEWWDGATWRQPVIAAPIQGGFKNLVIKNDGTTPSSKTDLTADAVVVTTAGGTSFQVTSLNLVLNIGTTGAGGLDTGAVAATTTYFVYVIYNPTTATAAGLYSLSATSPTLPSGYTASARLGAVITDGSSNFYRILQKNRHAQYTITASTNTSVPPTFATGTAGTYSDTSPTLTSVSVATLVPSTAITVTIMANGNWGGLTGSNVLVAPNTAYGGANNGPKGSNGMTFPIWLRPNAGDASDEGATAEMVLESTNVAWCSSNNGAAISPLGWEDNI